MTRELKLALIVGFSLVLFVTVLVSDHLSRARRAELPQVVAPASFTSAPPAVQITPPHEPRTAPASVTPRATPAIDPGSPFGAPSPGIAAATPGTAPADAPASTDLAALVKAEEKGVLPGAGATFDNPVVIHQDPRMQVKPIAPNNPGTGPAPGPNTPMTPNSSGKPTFFEPAPPAPKIPEYAVQEGDTLYELSKKFYKDPKHWKALQAYNKGRLTKDGSPRAGASILVPSLDVLLGKPVSVAVNTTPDPAKLPALVNAEKAAPDKPKPSKAAAKTYKVQKDDTLTSIAQRMLGSHRRVNDLIRANPDIDPENMKVGTEIRIPA